ncbi:MAG: carboxypeptidase regulatory-like domain-containing protein [Bacteroidota bacterium]
MKKQLLILAVLLCAGSFWAQNPGSIIGKVLNSEDQISLPGASVYIELGGEKMGTFTDVEGRFTIKPVPPGVYTLFISYTGYHPFVLGEVRVDPDRISFAEDIQMVPKAIEIIGTTIYGDNPDRMFKKDEPQKMTMLQKEIRLRADGKNLKSLVANLGDGVSTNADGSEIYFRGSRAMAFNYYIDGVKMDADSRINIPSRSISSMSVYAGGIPAKYGDVTGGVIIIETLTYGELYRQWKARNM